MAAPAQARTVSRPFSPSHAHARKQLSRPLCPPRPPRLHTRRTHRHCGRARFAALRGETALWLDLRQARPLFRRNDQPLESRPHSFVDPLRAGHLHPGGKRRIARRHDQIPLSHRPRSLHRIGFHPRRRPRHAVRLLTGGMQNGVRVLYDRPTGLHVATHRSRYSQSGLFAART